MTTAVILSATGNRAVTAGAPDGTKLLAVTWKGGAVHCLDRDFNSLGSFSASTLAPNGIAAIGATVWIGATGGSGFVSVHDLDGGWLGSWSDPTSAFRLTDMTLVGGELAVQNGGRIQFHDPWSGELLRSIDAPSAGIEGLAWNPEQGALFALGKSLYVLDATDGNVMRALPNPARDEPFRGTALAYIGRNRMLVGTSKGNWYVVDADRGDVLRRGNNGLDMFGLTGFSDLCPEDLDRTGDVGYLDVLMILEHFGAAGGAADLDDSGAVGPGDIERVLNGWGPCP